MRARQFYIFSQVFIYASSSYYIKRIASCHDKNVVVYSRHLLISIFVTTENRNSRLRFSRHITFVNRYLVSWHLKTFLCRPKTSWPDKYPEKIFFQGNLFLEKSKQAKQSWEYRCTYRVRGIGLLHPEACLVVWLMMFTFEVWNTEIRNNLWIVFLLLPPFYKTIY